MIATTDISRKWHEDAAGVVYLQVVVFVNLDAALVYRQILQRKSDAPTEKLGR